MRQRCCILIAMCVLLISVSGCRHRKEWVIGGDGSVARSQTKDAVRATSTAQSYVDAWLDEDYQAMYKLEPMAGRLSFVSYAKLAEVWRTKGFAHSHGFDPSPEVSVAGVVAGMSDPQAQMLLAVCTKDAETLEGIRTRTWPEKVVLVRVKMHDLPFGVLMIFEDGKWMAMNQPGQLEDAIPGFWKALRGTP